jgi:AbiV family abortive infection protein
MTPATQYNTFRDLCLQNAEEALNAGELLFNKGSNHLAFHLSALALEEIGKIFIGWYNIEQSGKTDGKSLTIPLDDHVKKLFWAIWGPSFGVEKLTRQQMEKYKQFALAIHNQRLDSLYTDLADTVPLAQKVAATDVQALIDIVKQRLADSRLAGDFTQQLDEEDTQLFNRFMEVTASPEKRAFLFSDAAQEKLITLGSFKGWVRDLLSHFDAQDNKLKEMLKVELDKPPIGSEKQVKPKWKLRITVLSPTHLIKAQPLNEFNQHSPIIKLSKGGTKNALIVDFTLPEFIGAPILYGYGWLNARLYVAALNVTSRGFFFWNTKQDTYKFYDKIWDLEKNAELSIRLAQEIKLDWPKAQQTLDAQELHLSRMVVDYFMDVYNTPDTVFVQHYLHGLAMLAKSDIHLRLEVQMLAHFFNVLETAMKKGRKRRLQG